MKKLLVQLFVVIIMINNLSSIYPMASANKAQQERLNRLITEKQNFFLTTTTINDIQQMARKLDKPINSNLLNNNLTILMLNKQSTLLMIRSRYDSLLEKKLNIDEQNKIKKAYSSLIKELSIMPFYTSSLNKLVNMSKEKFAAVWQSSELDIFTQRELNKLKKNLNDLFSNPEDGLKHFFNLGKEADHHVIAKEYNEYIERNNLDQLKNQVIMKKISYQDYRIKILKINAIKKAYEEYSK